MANSNSTPEPRRMSIAKLVFCLAVLKLDRIPRYGRVYDGRMRWQYQRMGLWGLDLLDWCGLLAPYLDSLEQTSTEAE